MDFYHLRNPDDSNKTMCDLKIHTRPFEWQDRCIDQPADVTCQYCKHVYSNNPSRYWALRAVNMRPGGVPVGLVWSDVDTPLFDKAIFGNLNLLTPREVRNELGL